MIKTGLQSPSFGVVLPMYNEERNIQQCLLTLNNFLKKIKHRTAIIVVNDGSQDQTASILGKIRQQIPRLIIIHHPTNQGYGAANVTGAKRAIKEKFDYALFMDADLTQKADYIFPFIEEMKKNTDYIKATRYRRGGGVKGVPLTRQIVSKVGNHLARVCLGLPLTDYTNGFRAVRTKILAQISCKEKGFAYLIEEVYQISKIAKSYAEVPYILTARENSLSKFNYSLRVYYNYLKYLFKK